MLENTTSKPSGILPQPDEKSFKLNSEKLIGYIMLLVGLIFIFAATFMVYGVLTGKSKPPKVFNAQSPTFRLPSPNQMLELPQGASLPAGLKLNQSESSSQDIKLIPDEVFNGSLNIGLYYLAMMFLASSGAKIAGLGIKLLK